MVTGKNGESISSTDHTAVFDRRQFCLAGAGLVLGACASPELSVGRSAGRPNIVFIMADDLGYADLSCYGRRDYETPHCDTLAARGVRFLQAYSNSPVCSATRTALITGRYQYRLPIGLEEPLLNRPVGLPPDHPTLPSILRAAGYRTALIGKWHLGSLPDYGPLKSGYETFYGFRGGGIDYFHHTGVLGDHDLWDGEIEIHETDYLTTLLGDRAVAQIDTYAAGEDPFFLSLHFSAPHWPWETPVDQAESKWLAQSDDPRALLHLDGGSLATYAGMVQSMDAQVGRVMEALRRNGLDRNTIVVFTSDNGGERFSDTWPFTGVKTELLEGGVRVPAILSWPERVRPGTDSEQVTISMDWVPTLLAAAGCVPDPDYPSDGMNLLPMLGGDPVRRTLFWRYQHLLQESCRDGGLKYLRINGNTFLFDLSADPRERANLKGRLPADYQRLVNLYRNWEAGMLPRDPEAFTHGYSGRDLADHLSME